MKVIVDSLPDAAKTRGVYTETALRERFLKVEELARRLALVPEKDATIVSYALSYLQSMLIIQPKELISKAELNNEAVDFTQLNTYEILNRTRYALIWQLLICRTINYSSVPSTLYFSLVVADILWTVVISRKHCDTRTC